MFVCDGSLTDTMVKQTLDMKGKVVIWTFQLKYLTVTDSCY